MTPYSKVRVQGASVSINTCRSICIFFFFFRFTRRTIWQTYITSFIFRLIVLSHLSSLNSFTTSLPLSFSLFFFLSLSLSLSSSYLFRHLGNNFVFGWFNIIIQNVRRLVKFLQFVTVVSTLCE